MSSPDPNFFAIVLALVSLTSYYHGQAAARKVFIKYIIGLYSGFELGQKVAVFLNSFTLGTFANVLFATIIAVFGSVYGDIAEDYW